MPRVVAMPIDWFREAGWMGRGGNRSRRSEIEIASNFLRDSSRAALRTDGERIECGVDISRRVAFGHTLQPKIETRHLSVCEMARKMGVVFRTGMT